MGANVLTRHSLAYPERVEAMMLVNTCTTKAGWVEWGCQKRNISHMRTTGITQTVLDYLLWHHLGDDFAERAHDILQVVLCVYQTQQSLYILGVSGLQGALLKQC